MFPCFLVQPHLTLDKEKFTKTYLSETLALFTIFVSIPLCPKRSFRIIALQLIYITGLFGVETKGIVVVIPTSLVIELFSVSRQGQGRGYGSITQ